ncbi:tRNA lysidine(34) synthetase TilS [Pseudonocardia sp. WMMC193]|uniref:tRNA lysidine(34) synthetase TilS n=1 Tax=Pseudonocardia sp. WMMC193 TaxID=2911965 RepID=UPI001F00ACC7|nr:tRNA lysidine(34) synthetase TilS [Pseudonocardia sp. WMMC193]MCF7552506.1 tRNA lysidine(34) synthetase TilS [Pseudonocardia sp. WMMC193]
MTAGRAGSAHCGATVRRVVADALARIPLQGAPVVGCSGGPDSLALLLAAHAVRADTVAAIVDHGLQPGSAERSQALATRLRERGIAAEVHPVVVTGSGGLEAAARRARYAALRAVRPGSPVLLGHTLDDQAETVLLGLGRGSGARSIAGMREWDEPWLRPLLGLRRAVVHAACGDLEPWSDPHNIDPRFTRARLRAEVLPLVEDVLPGATEALARTAAQLREDDEALSAWAARLRDEAESPAGLDVAVLRGAPAAVRRRVLRDWLCDVGITALTDAHLRSADALVGEWRGQGGPRLPGGLDLVRRDGRLSVQRFG